MSFADQVRKKAEQFKEFFTNEMFDEFGAHTEIEKRRIRDALRDLAREGTIVRISRGFYQYQTADFPDSNQEFQVHLARLRAEVGFNTKASIAAFVQYNSADDVFSANVRFRYNFREGQDLWIVYNEGVNTDRFSYDPVPPETDFRTVLVKYTHTFAM